MAGAPLATARGTDPRSLPVHAIANCYRAKAMAEKKRVLILCTGNSARSQMVEGILRPDCGGAFEVFSAGVKASFVRLEAIQAMSEIGIDISNHRSKSIEEFIDQQFDYVITVCNNAKESCPVF